MANGNWKEMIKRLYFVAWFCFSALGVASVFNMGIRYWQQDILAPIASIIAFIFGPAVLYFATKYIFAGMQKKSS